MEIRDALSKFLVQLRADGRSEHTVAQYQRHVGGLALWAASAGLCRDVAELGHEDVAAFLAAPVARTCADGRAKRPSSVNALRASLRGFFGYCARVGWIQRDPSRVLRNARCGPAPPRALSEAQVGRLRMALASADTAAEKRDAAMFLAMLDTGIRLGSAIGLDVEDIDFEAGEATVGAKGGRTEAIFLPEDLQALLAEHVAGRSGPAFVGTSGRRVTARHAQRRFALWLRRAGIRGRFSPHALRHTFATGLYRRTGDVLLVREALGHRSLSSTLIYARADREQLRRVVAESSPRYLLRQAGSPTTHMA